MSPGTPLAGFVHVFEPAPAPGGRTLLLLHGTGGDEENLLPLGRMLDDRAARLSPRGAVLEHGAPRFFRRIAEGVFDLDDLARRTDDLARFVEEAAALYGFDCAKLCAVGFSNGANIAASLLLRRPGVLREAVLFRAMTPFEPQATPGLHGARVFLSNGRHDPFALEPSAAHLAELLRAAGADVVQRWDDRGHTITHEEVHAAREWLAGARTVA